MKIAFIKRNFSYYGGAERYLATLINSLKKNQCEIHIYANKWLKNEEILFHKVPILQFGSFLKAYTFNKNLKINLKDFDCVISFERTTCQHIYRAGEGCHIKWLELRSKFESMFKRVSFKMNPLHRYYLKIEKEIFEKTPIIIANSNMVKREIMDYYGISPEKITVIYNGVDIEKFSPENRKKQYYLREQLNLPHNSKILLFIGSGFKRKGLDTLLKVLTILKERDIFLIVIGKGNIKQYLKICKSLGIENNVQFLGIRRDIENFYALADLFVLPTIYDPFSNATLEAMATGLPVVTTKNNGASELIEEGKEGFIVGNLFNYSDLADKINLALRDTKRMGDSARKKAEQFSIERIAEEFMECIKKFLS
ncbi:MAG: glycosyltransferase family 4 protein [Thermodesulfovibrio sp.]|nr:glycosyltransferase family 4 protein [Thermodesulfovibrio sp.]MDW7998114.1 glycosyltransferase family 4 protein [Thermodesulfovibrio sp.]